MNDDRYNNVMGQFGNRQSIGSRLADRLENSQPINIKMPNIPRVNRTTDIPSDEEWDEEVQQEMYDNTVQDSYSEPQNSYDEVQESYAENDSENIQELDSNIIDNNSENVEENHKQTSNNRKIDLSQPVHPTQYIFAIAVCIVMVIVIYFVANVTTFLMNNVDPGVSQQYFNSTLEEIFEKE